MLGTKCWNKPNGFKKRNKMKEKKNVMGRRRKRHKMTCGSDYFKRLSGN
jgi:hypothetical protein